MSFASFQNPATSFCTHMPRVKYGLDYCPECEGSVSVFPNLFIQYADRPLPLVKPQAVTQISFLETRSKLTHNNVPFNSEIHYSPRLHSAAAQHKIADSQHLKQLPNLFQQLEKILTTPLKAHPGLVVCNGALGLSVFTQQVIQRYEPVCLFTGRMMSMAELYQADQRNTQNESITFVENNIGCSTVHERGIGSLIQHMPESLEPKEWVEEKLPPAGKISLANVSEELIQHQGELIVVFLAKRTIQAGEQIGFDYGNAYFSSRNIIPQFFHFKTGEVVCPARYLCPWQCVEVTNLNGTKRNLLVNRKDYENNPNPITQFYLRGVEPESFRTQLIKQALQPATPAAVVKGYCPLCGIQASLQCGRCKQVSYCSPECQKVDWSTHKKSCN